MNYRFRSRNHPEANGRQPVSGEESFRLLFATEEGGSIEVMLGHADFVNHVACLVAVLREDKELKKEVDKTSKEIEKIDAQTFASKKE